ncbi:MAG TPA: hypothetical protein VFJ71_03275 [Candidatus Limnocylindrales bacterium]|nr:hypothetical protein [Candidatus Limnocylindrales bacterium]
MRGRFRRTTPGATFDTDLPPDADRGVIREPIGPILARPDRFRRLLSPGASSGWNVARCSGMQLEMALQDGSCRLGRWLRLFVSRLRVVIQFDGARP